MNTNLRFALLGVAAQLCLLLPLSAQLIDNPPPPFADPPSPWHAFAANSVVTFSFQTSHDGIGWTWDQKQLFRDAIYQMDDVLPQISFVEAGDFTMRWAGADFFRDWRDATHQADGWDLRNPLAVSYKHNNGPWDPALFPNNEIYFNNQQPWSYNFLNVDPAGYDFWTVALHEIIHMLACDAHSTDPEEVMYPSLKLGERKSLKLSDLNILLTAGYQTDPARIREGPIPVPEPSTYAVAAITTLLALALHRRHQSLREKSSPAARNSHVFRESAHRSN